jgi:cell division control protein 6
VTRFVCQQLLRRGAELGVKVNAIEVNCCIVDTKYRVLANIGNELAPRDQTPIPFTGWPSDKVLERLRENMDKQGGVHVIVLDEIDHLVRKNGDGVLYPLTSLNYELRNSRCCVIGITNDLKFTDLLDARVTSRLGSEDLVFKPYVAAQIEDILSERAIAGVREGVLGEGVIKLCAALAAQEHGDARRALDLLRIAVQKAEQNGAQKTDVSHVRLAQNQLEFDQITPVIEALPIHQKFVLYAILLNEMNGLKNVSAGEAYAVYQMVCEKAKINSLVSRSITSVIKNLDSLGLISARTISLGRYGRSNRINSCVPETVDPIAIMEKADPMMVDVVNASYRLQDRL